MIDPYCPECRKYTAGCDQHNRITDNIQTTFTIPTSPAPCPRETLLEEDVAWDAHCERHRKVEQMLRDQLRDANLQIGVMKAVVDAAVMWADPNVNPTDSIPWLENAVTEYRRVTLKQKEE